MHIQELFENNRRDITVAMMKNYPLLLRKFMADQTKVPALVEIALHLNLELYSLKRQEQVNITKYAISFHTGLHLVWLLMLVFPEFQKYSSAHERGILQAQ